MPDPCAIRGLDLNPGPGIFDIKSLDFLYKILGFLDALASLDFTLVSKSVIVSNLGAQNHVIDLTQI